MQTVSASVQPIIVIGMHRSGTTMICQLLERLGLFVGVRKDENYEARFFHDINLWLFSQSGARWDNPLPNRYLMENPQARALATDYIRRYLLSSPSLGSYLGPGKYLSYRSAFRIPVAWGWKSPLNTFTLPIWLDLFPNARIIHIYRHGVDVANSLRVRNRKDMRRTRAQDIYYRMVPLHWIKRKQGTFIDSVRCASLKGGLELWQEYLTEASTAVEQNVDRSMEIKYEDFLAQPASTLSRIADFCQLDASANAIEDAASSVRLERAFAYQKDPELKEFSVREAQRLATRHY
jgi:hypothetical protein